MYYLFIAIFANTKSGGDLKTVYAEVAQLVERQPSKLNVASSTLVFRSWKIKRRFKNRKNAEVAQLVERQPSKLNVASSTLVFRSWKIKRRFKNRKRGSSSVGRASAFQAECREFDPRLPLLETKNLIKR